MARFFKLLVLVPIAILILAFAIANRQTISISFDPFSTPDASSAFITAPLFILMFLSVIVGVIIGGIATWFTQGRNRRKARAAREEAEQWREEVLRLRREPQLMSAPSGRGLARLDA